MKKYKIFEDIGNILLYISVLMILFTMCIDLDTSQNAWKYMLGMAGIDILVILMGLGMIYLVTVESVVFAVFSIICAWLYKLIKLPVDVMRECYKFKCKKRTYRRMFFACVHSYDRYIENKLKEEA